jgi:hypothetical protein
MKMLDFNALQQPTWQVKLKDDAQTVVTLTTPTVDLVDRLLAAAPDIETAVKTQDGRTIQATFELIASIMNCNEEGLTFTAEELRDKYKLTLVDLFCFVAGYMAFIKELQDAKN